jgi:hypothetical protein
MGPAEPDCERLTEPSRPLAAGRPPDMEHLREDVVRAKAAARAFSEAVAARPLLSDSIDAQAGARTAPARARAWCEATLAVQIAADHQLPLDVVRAAFGPSLGDTFGPVPGAHQPDGASPKHSAAPR